MAVLLYVLTVLLVHGQQASGQAVNPPTGLTAVQVDLTSIKVSWTAQSSGGANVTGYRISYQTGGGSEQSVDVGPTATSHTLTTGLQSGATYSISIVALSSTLPSTVVGPEMVILKAFEAPIVMTSVLGPTSIRVIFTQPSGSLAAESYDIQYTRVTGAAAGQTLCGSVQDTGTTTDVQSPFTITNLEEFSSYDFTVTARAFSAMRATTEQAFTSPAVPSGPPQSVMTSSVTSSSITVQWGRVRCIDRNSEITGYTVRYDQTGSTTTAMESVSGTSNRVFTASGLISRTSYTFEVAAVSSEGTGPFSTGTTVETTISEGIALQLSGQCYGNNSLVSLTAIGEGDTAALLCLTDREQCCRSSEGGLHGEWYFPDGGLVPDGFEGTSIYRNRRASRVRLNRRNNAQSPTGVYRCEVPDVNGPNQSIYVGVYQQSSGNLTSSAIAYNGTSNTLVCTSTGGPATTVTWRKDDVVLDKGVPGYGIFQIITNTTEATYDNVLQLNGTLDNIIGNYSCDVSNIKSTQDAVYTIQGLQISGHVDTLQLGESYSITCTTDLEVATIEWLDSATMEVIEVGNSSLLSLELQGVGSTLNGANYTCRTTSPHGVQERSITLTVELRSSTSPITTAPDVPVPDPPVVTLGVVTATTVTLSWSPQPGVGQYELRYVRAVGSQQHGACRDFIDTGSVTTTENSLTVARLQEFSTYTVTVFAVNNAGRVPSEEIAILTPEAAPAPPRGVEVVNFTDTAITVHWEPLECIDINSQFEITGYTVRYGFSHEHGISTEISSSLPVRTINVLAPGFEYFIEVAAVNSNGETGEYSNRIIQTTSGGQSSCSAGGTETATVAAASVVVVLVVLILALSGVVIAVLVLKHKRGAPPLTQQPPTEAMVLTTFPESTKPPAAISTGPNAAYQTVASGGRGQSQGNDGDHTYEYIVPPGLQSRDQPEPPHVYEST